MLCRNGRHFGDVRFVRIVENRRAHLRGGGMFKCPQCTDSWNSNERKARARRAGESRKTIGKFEPGYVTAEGVFGE